MYYIVEINQPCVFYELEAAMDEIVLRSKQNEVYCNGTFKEIVNGIYVYEFAQTIPAKGAKITDFILQQVLTSHTLKSPS